MRSKGHDGWTRWLAAAIIFAMLGIAAVVALTWFFWQQGLSRSANWANLTRRQTLVGSGPFGAVLSVLVTWLAWPEGIQHLATAGPKGVANGPTYYNTLGVQPCSVLVATTTQGGATFPGIKHVAVGGDTKDQSATVIDALMPDTVRNGVKTIVFATA
ncbi:hypothetical protein [Dactylosporangium sp. NPDC051484]|uniref:hypothetical protein n=1 Tax=Dactylosporangium sp. NPDC051484 TaxID=3154942 RepID=UPI00344F0F22